MTSVFLVVLYFPPTYDLPKDFKWIEWFTPVVTMIASSRESAATYVDNTTKSKIAEDGSWSFQGQYYLIVEKKMDDNTICREGRIGQIFI